MSLSNNQPSSEPLKPHLPEFNYDESFRLTQSPHPTFGPGNSGAGSSFLDDWRLKGETVGFTTIDAEKMEPRHMYRLLIGGVTPRPIAFVSSVSPNGVRNLAPFSFFNVVNYEPPLIIISCHTHDDGKEKDTAANIKATKTFTVNMVSEPFVEGVNWAAIDAPSDVDEWHGSGLTPQHSTLVEPPRVKESAFSMECELLKDIDLVPSDAGAHKTAVLIIGLIKLIHVRNDVLTHPDDINAVDQGAKPWTIDAAKLRAVSRMGGITYGRIGEAFELARADWRDPKHQVYSVKPHEEAKEGCR